MDLEWALAQAKQFGELVERCNAIARTNRSLYLVTSEYEAATIDLDLQRLVAERVAKALGETDIADAIAERTGSGLAFGMNHLTTPAAQLVSMIERREELAEKLGPTGPMLSAAQMHKWVWSAAAGLWNDGHRRAAVQQAAVALLDGHLPAKLEVAKTQAEPATAFGSDEPRAGSPRLRLPGFTKGTQDWTSAHDGAKFLGMACQKLVRNLTSHGAGELEEQAALEQLAMVSQFARLVDSAQVEPI